MFFRLGVVQVILDKVLDCQMASLGSLRVKIRIIHAKPFTIWIFFSEDLAVIKKEKIFIGWENFVWQIS